MRTVDTISMAMTNLRRQKLRSALTAFAIVIGAASVTIMLTLVTSAQGFATAQTTGNGQDTQVAISPTTGLQFGEIVQGQGYDPGASSTTKLDDASLAKIKAIPTVSSVVPMLFPQVFAQSEVDGKTESLRGGVVSYGTEPGVTHQMLAGRWVNDQDATRTVAISSAQAAAWGFGAKPQALVGKQIKLITKDWYSGPGSGQMERMQQQGSQPGPGGGGGQQLPTTFDVTITGVTTDGDNNIIYPSWAWAKELVEHPQGSKDSPSATYVSQIDETGYSAAIAVTLSPDQVPSTAKAVEQLGFGAATAEQSAQKQQQAFRIIGFVLGGIGGIALLVAAIGVINTMLMSVLERTREIGVMRALGASRRAVRRLFTIEAASLGLIGGLVGVGVGYLLALVANPLVNNQLKSKGLTSRDIINVPPLLAIAVVVTTTVIGILAGLLPAARAARMDPVEALRTE